MDNPNPSQPHTKIDIIPQQQPPFSFEFAEKNIQEPQRLPFFKSRSRQTKSDTWLISLFVLLQILIFAATMWYNNCSTNSDSDCTAIALGRLSFQPLYENPLLGPSASTLDEMGALQRHSLVQDRHTWRLFTSPWLHAGVIHLIINLASIIFVGIYLEQEFGPLRIGMIYLLSAFSGSFFAALFVRNSPVVCSSGALFGLLGAMLAALLRNWDFYSKKFSALMIIFIISVVNFLFGLLPYVDNFSNIGGFISGFLLGFVLLFTPQLRQVAQHKAGLSKYGAKTSFKLKEKLDRPVLRSVSLLLFGILLAGCLVAVLEGIDINRYCKWCRYVDCVPSSRWSCSDVTSSCEAMASNTQLTLTCMGNGNFRVFPFTNISQARTKDLCTLICS